MFAAATRIGAEGFDRAIDLALTASGEVVVAGTYRGPFAVGDDVAPTAPGVGLFVVRFGADGRPRWFFAQPITGGTLNQLRLALDPSDAPVLAATAIGSRIDIGSGPLELEGSSDLLLLRLTNEGVAERAVLLGGPQEQTLNGLAVGQGGDVWLSGWYRELDLGIAPPLRASGSADGFVARLDRDLDPIWVRPVVSDGGFATITAVGVGPNDQAAVVVRADRAASVHERRLELEGGGAAVLRLDPDGGVTRTLVLRDDSGSAELLDAVVDDTGRVHAGGSFRGRLRVGERRLVSRGVDGLWLRWGPDDRVELGALGGSGSDRVRAVAADPLGRTWTTGGFDGELGYARGRLDAGAGIGAFVARVDRDGRVRRADQIVGTRSANTYSAGVAAGRRTGTWWLGGYEGSAVAGRFSLGGPGAVDVLLLRLEPR